MGRCDESMGSYALRTGAPVRVVTRAGVADVEVGCPGIPWMGRQCGATHWLRGLDAVRVTELLTRRRRVQDAFPELSPADREMLVTGWCPKCQRLAFGEDGAFFADELGEDGDD